jgi:N-acyl homoserine lactone hydrolase
VKKILKRVALLWAMLILLALALLVGTFTAKTIDVEAYKGNSDKFVRVESTHALGLPDTTLSIIKCGKLVSKPAFVYRGGSWSGEYESGMAAVLIRHPRATFLFDAGFGTNVDNHIKTIPAIMRALTRYDKETSAAAQLRAQGISPAQIRMIIISHLHWDHVSGLEDFPQAETWLASEEERYIEEQPEGELIRQLRGKLTLHSVAFSDGAYENFDRSLDVFRDGSVVLVPLPGHTPGSLGMFVNLRSGKRFLFTGDLTWSIEGQQIPAERPWLLRKLADFDEEGVKRSIVKVYELMKEYPGLVVVPAHDRRIHTTIASFPAVER